MNTLILYLCKKFENPTKWKSQLLKKQFCRVFLINYLQLKNYEEDINHAPIRKEILSPEEKKLALKNALRYFHEKHHAVLAPEFAEELKKYGRIYMYRFRPDYEIYARHIDDFPHQSKQAAAIMLMIHE